MIDAWKVLEHAPSNVRLNVDNLAKIQKYLDETGESIATLKRKMPVAGQQKWANDIVGYWENLKKLKPEIKKLNLSEAEAQSIIKLYKDSPDLIPHLKGTIQELAQHGLNKENSIKVLNNKLYVEALELRTIGITIKPSWWGISKSELDDIWLLITKDKYKQEIQEAMVLNPQLTKREIIIKKKKERLVDAIEAENQKNSKNVREIGIVYGRDKSRKSTRKLSASSPKDQVFITDRAWVTKGISEPGARTNVWLNAVQAAETAVRLKAMNIIVAGQHLEGRLYFSLVDYNLPSVMTAMYRNPNVPHVAIAKLASEIPRNPYSFAKITDMELSNLVRNKEWFDITDFIEVTNGVAKVISKQEAAKKYGIKYIGDIMSKKIK